MIMNAAFILFGFVQCIWCVESGPGQNAIINMYVLSMEHVCAFLGM